MQVGDLVKIQDHISKSKASFELKLPYENGKIKRISAKEFKGKVGIIVSTTVVSKVSSYHVAFGNVVVRVSHNCIHTISVDKKV